MKEINVFQVISNTDMTEGRGQARIVGNFSSEQVADQASYDQGVMGSKANVQRNVIKVFETIEEYMEETGNEVRGITDVIRKEALAKLSNTEKKILGLN